MRKYRQEKKPLVVLLSNDKDVDNLYMFGIAV